MRPLLFSLAMPLTFLAVASCGCQNLFAGEPPAFCGNGSPCAEPGNGEDIEGGDTSTGEDPSSESNAEEAGDQLPDCGERIKIQNPIRAAIESQHGLIYSGGFDCGELLTIRSLSVMEPLNSLEGLEHLEAIEVFTAHFFEGTDLAPVSQLPNLAELTLIGDPNNSGADGIAVLGPLVQLPLPLIKLALPHQRLSDFEHFSSLTQLEALDLSYNLLGDANTGGSLFTFPTLPSLVVLDLSGNRGPDGTTSIANSLSELGRLPGLRSLAGRDIELISVTLLPKGTPITSLDLSSNMTGFISEAWSEFDFPDIQLLNLATNTLSAIPDAVMNIFNLRDFNLNVQHNFIASLGGTSVLLTSGSSIDLRHNCFDFEDPQNAADLASVQDWITMGATVIYEPQNECEVP